MTKLTSVQTAARITSVILIMVSLLLFAVSIEQRVSGNVTDVRPFLFACVFVLLAIIAYLIGDTPQLTTLPKEREYYETSPKTNRYKFDKYLEEIYSRELNAYTWFAKIGSPQYSPNVVKEIREKLSSGEFDEK